MKATDLLKLIENSKTKSVPGELGKQTYQNDNTPNNHVKGKGTKEVTAKAGGEKRDKKPTADVGSPRKREKRSMEGPGSKARSMNEALSAKEIGSYVLGSSRDPSTGLQAVQLKDINRGQDISVPMSDPKIYRNLLAAIKGNDDNLANRAYNMLINSPNASLSKGSSFKNKEVGAMGKGAHSGGAMARRGGTNVGSSMSQDQIDNAANKFSLASSKGSTEKRIRESGAESSDSMGKEKVATAGKSVSRSATVKTMPMDKKPTAVVGNVKRKEKRSMGENPAPVKDSKGGENQHKSMKKMHEAISDLETWLESDLNLMENDLETFYMDDDQPTACPMCGSRTDFDDATGTAQDPQHHKCLNGKCGFEFKGEFEPEGEFGEGKGDDPIMKSDFMDRKTRMEVDKPANVSRKVKQGTGSKRVPPGRGYRR